MKLVLDTDVIVAALRSPTGASAELLRLARHRRFTPVVSVPLVLEYEAVATRPEHLAAAELSAREVQIVLDVLIGMSEWTRIHYLYRPRPAIPPTRWYLKRRSTPVPMASSPSTGGIMGMRRPD